MEFQVWIQHNEQLYDATSIIEDGVIWDASVLGEAGKLRFRVIRDGIINFVEGDRVRFVADGEDIFCGWVMTKERDENQIITVTAYDQLFYLAKNKETLVYWDKTARELIELIGAKHQMTLGEIMESGWKIPQRIEEGQSLLDMIMSAIEMMKKATGKEFFFYDKGGKLMLKDRESMVLPVILSNEGGISRYWYRTDISNDTFNTVKLYQAGRKETERLTYEEKRADKVDEWGQLQYYQHVSYQLSEAQLQEIAKNILKEKCRVEKHLTIENINGGEVIRAGNSVYLSIPDLSEIGMQTTALVENVTHTFSDGEHRQKMVIRLEGSAIA